MATNTKRQSCTFMIGTRLRLHLAYTGIHVILMCGAVVMMVPFIFMLSTSVNADAWTQIPFPVQLVPEHFSLNAYSTAIQGLDFGRLYLNTFIVAAVQILISLVSATLSGYALSKIRPRGSRIFLIGILSTMMIPLEATLIPNFLTFKAFGVLDTYVPLWIPAIAYTFGTFFIKQYLDSLPSEMRESAKLDGATELRILFSVYLPLVGPVLATCGVLLFLGIWNAFLWPLVILNTPSLYTLQLGIAQYSTTVNGGRNLLPALNMAATVLSAVPVLAVYFVLQRFVVRSVANSALKG